MTPDPNDVARFLEEAVARGLMSAAAADDCRRVLAVLAEVDIEMGIDRVAIRKGYLDKEAADELQRALARRRVGRYEVLERLGSGGTGVVWRARDTRLGRVVALKLLARPRDPNDVLSSYAARFEREARTAVTLNHVNIVRGLDFGEADGYVYFAMEFVAGETAAARVRREGRLTESAAIRIAVQVVEALRYVQRFHLVHRDLKPENLLLTPTGEVKVCDLGLAKPTLEESARFNVSGVIAGTPLYMAPEQIRSPDSIDWRTDVYGLGATLYHLLTGRPPFVPRPGTSVIQRHLSEAVVDPREHVLELSSGTSIVVRKMLAKRPDDRYASLDDLASDLSALLDGRPPSFALSLHSGQERVVQSILAESHAARRRRAPRRRRALIGVATGVVAAVLAAAWPTDAWRSADVTRVRPPRTAVVTVRPEPEVGCQDTGGGASPPPASPPSASLTAAASADPGSALLARAGALEDQGAPLDETIGRYRFVAETYGDRPSGKAAGERLKILEERFERLASDAVDALSHEAEAAVRAGEYARAADLLANCPSRYARTKAFGRALEESTRITAEGRAFMTRAYSEAERAAVAWEFAAADSWLDRAAAAAVPGFEARRGEVQIALELARRAHAEERAARLEPFRLVAGRALIDALSDVTAAERAVAAALDDDSLRTYRAELQSLLPQLELPARALATFVRGWDAWATARRDVSFRTTGATSEAVTGRAVGVDGRAILVGAAGEAPRPVPLRAVPPDVLLAAVRTGLAAAGTSGGAGPEELTAALLLALRRPDAAAGLDAPAEWVSAVRAVAVDEARSRIAAALGSGRAPVEIRRDLDAVIAAVPWFPDAYRERGRLLERLGDVDGALVDYGRALERDRGRESARVEIARLLERRRKFAEAEAHLRLFLDDPGDADAETLAAADEALRRVVEGRVDVQVAAWWREAKNALRGRDPDTAVPLLEQILRERPDEPDALLGLGRLYTQRGAIFPAYRLFLHLVEVAPNPRTVAEAQREILALEEHHRVPPPKAFDALREGRVALAEGRPGDAVVLFGRAVLLGPFQVDAHLALAEAQLAQGLLRDVRSDLQAAVRAADDTLVLAPDHAPAILVRARARLALGEVATAVADADRAAALLPDPSDALSVAGRGLIEQGEPDAALRRFEAAYRARPRGELLYWQAVALERQGRRREALLELDLIESEWSVDDAWRAGYEALVRRLRQ